MEKGIFEKIKSLFTGKQEITPDANALTAAILTEDEDEARRILEKGQNPNLPDDLGRLPIHFAAEKNKPNLLLLLLLYGADINILDDNGNTALMSGARLGSAEACLVLINAGVDYFLINNKGKTALDISKETGHREVTTLFFQRSKELKLIISKIRKVNASKYSELSKTALGIENSGPGKRIQKAVGPSGKSESNIMDHKSLPELELELARLEKMLGQD